MPKAHSSRDLFKKAVGGIAGGVGSYVMGRTAARSRSRTPTPVKHGVKRERSASRPRTAKRHYGSINRTKNRQKDKGSNAAKPGISFGGGRVIQPSRAFVQRVTAAASKINHRIVESTATTTGNLGESAWTEFALDQAADLQYIQDKIALTDSKPTMRFQIVRSSLSIQLANFSTGAMFGVVYHIKLKRDLPSSLSAYGAIQTGLGQAAVGVREPVTALATKPTDSILFNAYFDIVSARKFELDPGMNTRITLNRGTKGISGTILTNATCAYIYRYTEIILIKQWGCMVDGATSGISTDKTKLNFEVTMREDYKWTADLDTTDYFSNNIPPIVGAIQYINPDSGVLQVDAQA